MSYTTAASGKGNSVLLEGRRNHRLAKRGIFSLVTWTGYPHETSETTTNLEMQERYDK